MRWFIWLWLVPVGYIVLWYVLSANDFGFYLFSREAHDLVFEIYGSMLNIEPATIPPMLLKALFLDSLIVLAVVAFFRRRRIAAWWRERSTVSS